MASQTTGIDAPPAVPTLAQYPVSDIYIQGYIQYNSNTQPAGSICDYTKPGKFWSRPLQLGENPESEIAMDAYVMTTGGMVWTPNFWIGTLAAAAAINIPIVPYTNEGPSAAYMALPIPCRQLTSTEQFVSAIGGAPPASIQNSANAGASIGTSGSATDPTNIRILNGINALLKAFNLPAV